MAGKKICPLLCQLLIMTQPAAAQKNDGEVRPYLVGKKLARFRQKACKHRVLMKANKIIAVILQAA